MTAGSVLGFTVFIDALAVVGSCLQQLFGWTCGHLADEDGGPQHQQNAGSCSNHVNRYILGGRVKPG